MGIWIPGFPHPHTPTPSTYHQEVIEQEDLSLVQSQLLGFVGVRNFKKPAVADQPSMGKREHLRRERHLTTVTCSQGTLRFSTSALWAGLRLHLPCPLPVCLAGSLTCHRELSVSEETMYSDRPPTPLSALFPQSPPRVLPRREDWST